MGQPALIQLHSSVPLPPPDEIRRKTAEILQNPDYVLGGKTLDTSLFGKVWEFFHRLFHPILAWFDALFAFSPLLWLLAIVGMFLIVILLSAHIWISLKKAIRGKAISRFRLPSKDRPQTPEDWERKAQDALGLGDFMAAVRCLFQASLLLLWRARKERPPRGTTNRELLIRYRNTPVFASLRAFVEVIDWKWYSDKPCVREDYDACSRAHGEIRRIAGEMMSRD